MSLIFIDLGPLVFYSEIVSKFKSFQTPKSVSHIIFGNHKISLDKGEPTFYCHIIKKAYLLGNFLFCSILSTKILYFHVLGIIYIFVLFLQLLFNICKRQLFSEEFLFICWRERKKSRNRQNSRKKENQVPC